MFDEKYNKKTIKELVDTLEALVQDYSVDPVEKRLTEIYYCTRFTVVGMIFGNHPSHAGSQTLVRDVADTVSETFVLKLSRNPRAFDDQLDLNNYIAQITTHAVWRHHNRIRRQQTSSIYLDDPENESKAVLSEMLETMRSPLRTLEIRDDVRKLVGVVTEVLQDSRFAPRWQLLLWPVLHTLIDGTDQLLDCLSYADRLALRVVLMRCEARVSRWTLSQIATAA